MVVYQNNNPLLHKQADYTAVVESGKSNTCVFDAYTNETIFSGYYTIYGFSPMSAWNLNPNDADFLTVNIAAVQNQTQANSLHLGAYMLMKAQDEQRIIKDELISLNFKHLASVIRFAVWNNSENSDLKLQNINVKLCSDKSVFRTKAKLVNMDATSLSVDNDANVSEIVLSLSGEAQEFHLKDGKEQCEGYMTVLPTDVFEPTDNLIVDMVLTDGTVNYTSRKTLSFGNASQAGFMQDGVKQGFSYFLKLKLQSEDLTIDGFTLSELDNIPTNLNTWVITDAIDANTNLVHLRDKLKDVYATKPTRRIRLVLPNTTAIGDGTFYDCKVLASVNLPVVTTIGDYAFYNCFALTSVSLPVATTIGSYTFYKCSALTSVNLPVATTIGELAFSNCEALTSVNLPDATTIENLVFYKCSALTTLEIATSSARLISVGTGLFYGVTVSNVDITVGQNEYDSFVNDGIWRDFGPFKSIMKK